MKQRADQIRVVLAGGLFLLTALPCLLGLTDRPAVLLWPPVLALLLILVTRMAALGLLLGGLAGALLVAQGDPLVAADQWLRVHLWPSLFGSWRPADGLAAFPEKINLWHLGSLVFTLLLGSLAAVIERGGGLQHFLSRDATGKPEGARRFLTSVYGLGLLCFFDGLANSLMVGRVSRGMADRLRIPREALAYVVDTTSSAVACVALVSTWIAMQLSLIAEGTGALGMDRPAYELFLASIPRNYYCLFALVLAFLVCRRGWWIGPMRRARPVPRDELGELAESPACARWRALVPLALLVPVILGFYYFLHPVFASAGEPPPPRFPITADSLHAALGSNAGPAAFVLGSAVALAAALAVYPPNRRSEAPTAAWTGARQMLAPLGILVLAWVFGSVLKEQGTARALADLLSGTVSPALLPPAVFLAGCAVSFVSGSSWGTMAILMPLALPALGALAGDSPDVLAHLVPAVIAAVFGGAVFGDHCSPFSDTTIVSAIACGITTPEHTLTQLPYALVAAGATVLLGYGLEAIGLPPLLGLATGLTVLLLVTRTGTRTPAPNPDPRS